jgi:DNA-directed RNA polymerase subunit L
MKIEVLENEGNKLKIKMHDNMTFINLLNENVWQQKIDVAAYTREHIYLTQPTMFVKSKDPKKHLLDAAEQIITDVETLRKRLKAQK